MILAVLVSSSVSKPNIVASASRNESGSYSRLVRDPAIGGVQNTMLEIDDLLASWCGTVTLETIYSINGQNVAIWCRHHVLLKIEAVLLNDFLECSVDVGVSRQIFLLMLKANKLH